MMVRENLEVTNKRILTVTSIFPAAMNTVARFFPSNVETHILIGAAPSDSAVPVAINFLLPKTEENAC